MATLKKMCENPIQSAFTNRRMIKKKKEQTYSALDTVVVGVSYGLPRLDVFYTVFIKLVLAVEISSIITDVFAFSMHLVCKYIFDLIKLATLSTSLRRDVWASTNHLAKCYPTS